MRAAQQHLRCEGQGTRSDGQFTLEPVYCLGMCAASPAIQVDEKILARMTPERMTGILTQLEVQG